ncbi:SusC/RagA family TonB-linked outer membrane protein [Saccharicrinis aurantiacus]|uniref:SusC/RagA family TonB-linked outer membrane protein n=1 Tax=Saccharicrinis aurantiacus TaxID=1849719 RepID=UPI000838BE96|nr:TonB-dependent receptor [Saccharicrinis aurantiacus]
MNKKNWVLNVAFLAMLFCGFSSVGVAQSVRVTGTVRDFSGELLPGVNIVEKGTFGGTITDFDGNYSIEVSSQEAVLMFSSIGLLDSEVLVGGQTTIDVILKDEVLDIDEVVVVGYGSMKKSDVTGSVTSVKTEQLSSIPANSVEGTLQGRVTGLQVINSSQEPGGGSDVRIRGGSSINGSNAPLVVVDGFPLGEAGNLSQINPNDIESMEVLKDASASAIYGSRGANGVIMITTKKAKEGVMKVEVHQQTTINQFSSTLLTWEDPALMARLSNEEMTNAGLAPLYIGAPNANGVYYPSISEIESGAWNHNTDWADLVFRNAPVSNNTSVSLRSANETTSFSLSTNYVKETGMQVGDDYEKVNIAANIQHKFSDRLTVSTSQIFSKDARDRNEGLAYWRNPLWPVYGPDGDYFKSFEQDFEHPLARLNLVDNKTEGVDYISNYGLNYNITSDITISSQLNYRYQSSINNAYNHSQHTEDGFFNNGAGYVNNSERHELLSETYITYDKWFDDKNHFTAMAGHSYRDVTRNTSDLSAFDFVNESLGNGNMGTGNPSMNRIGNYYENERMLSFYGRVNYIYDDRFLVTGTIRSDASSKFGANNRTGYFPSGAASWKMHNEEWIQDLNVFDELKPRVSYGVSGNQDINPYSGIGRYGSERYYSNGSWNTGIGPGYEGGRYGDYWQYVEWHGLSNPDLKWETTKQLDIGLDFAFFNRRLRGHFDYYHKKTEDLLDLVNLPLSSGYDKVLMNNGVIQNQGIELGLDANVVNTKDFSLNANFVFSRNRTEVLDFGSAEESGLQTDPNTGMLFRFRGDGYIDQFRQGATLLAIGQPLNVFYGYKTDGIIQSVEEGHAAGLTGQQAQPGEFKYVDLNGDGMLSPDDRTIIGDPNPDFMASLTLDLNYKNWDLSMFFNGVFGNDVIYVDRFNQPDAKPLRWTPDNQTNLYPSLNATRQYLFSDAFIQDGSFVRLQNIVLGYTFDVNKVDFISSARVYVNASNLFTWSKFEGYDPEVGLNGIYNGGYPLLRGFTFGLNVSF